MKIYLLLLLLFAASCTPKLEKALKVVTKTPAAAAVALEEIGAKQEPEAAKFAARKYPVKRIEGPTVKTVQKGNADEIKAKFEDARAEADSLLLLIAKLPNNASFEQQIEARDNVIKSLRKRQAELQNTPITADIEQIRQTIVEENTAALKVLENQIADLKDKLREQEFQTRKANERADEKDTELTETKKTLGWTQIGILFSVVVVAAIVALKLFRR